MNWFWDNVCLKKEERTSMFAFICLLFGLLMIKWYMVVMYEPSAEFHAKEQMAKMEFVFLETEVKENNTSEKPSTRSPSTKEDIDLKKKSKNTGKKKTLKKMLFDFDPNVISADSLMLLGFSKYAANNLDRYRSKGGKIKDVDDLGKIYGLDRNVFEEVRPYVKIESKKEVSIPKMVKENKSIVSTEPKLKSSSKSKWKLELNSINVNTADTLEFRRLKGIGKVYANRIVKYRNSLGGYFSIDQINQVWGISDSLFMAIKPYLSVDPLTIAKRNINSMDKKMLARHPYIDWKKAKIITNYRKMHGDFESMDDFQKLHGLSMGFVDTLTQYFIAE